MGDREGRLQRGGHDAAEVADVHDDARHALAAAFDEVAHDDVDEAGGDGQFVHETRRRWNRRRGFFIPPLVTGRTDAGKDSSPWLLWQIMDSAFPVGSFAHSGGLEAAVQFGFVTDAHTLAEFLRVSLTQAARLSAPFARATAADPSTFVAANERYDTLLVNDPANRASRAMGLAVLTAGDAMLPDAGLAGVRDTTRRATGFVHLPPAWGLLARAVGLDDVATVDAFLFQHVRGLLSAAVRLNVVGPMQAQCVLAALKVTRQDCIDLARRTTVDTATGTAPTLDLLQSLHERLYSRLFNS